MKRQWETLKPTSSWRDEHQRITVIKIYNYDKCSKEKEKDSVRLRGKEMDRTRESEKGSLRNLKI